LLDFRQAVGASERLFCLLDRKPKIPATANESCFIQPIDFDGSVRFDHVCFTYPSRSEQLVLTNISFTIEHRQKVALVGPSGSGKSTIASLIERFYDPDSGAIYFNSQPLSSIDPQWLRQNVSFVNQEPSLFACSIRDNITFGVNRAMISLDEIIHVAKLANAHQFIEQFEEKYDTLVGERGVCLSGGQRQRLASKCRIENEPIRDYR
jgi:ABC-type multidrug transport system fused ATPase/permease subunit